MASVTQGRGQGRGASRPGPRNQPRPTWRDRQMDLPHPGTPAYFQPVVSNPNNPPPFLPVLSPLFTPIQPPPPQLQAPQQGQLLSMTLADLFASLHIMPAQLQPPQLTTPLCTLGSGRPPKPVKRMNRGSHHSCPYPFSRTKGDVTNSSNSILGLRCRPLPGRGRPPQPVPPGARMELGQPPQLPQPTQQDFWRQGLLAAWLANPYP
jgi:hypothetical protein